MGETHIAGAYRYLGVRISFSERAQVGICVVCNNAVYSDDSGWTFDDDDNVYCKKDAK